LFMNLSVSIAGIRWKNPVATASGTFASGREYSEFFNIGALGAVTTKGVSLKPWPGNPPPRIAETYGGMLNSVGLQNPGAAAFIENDLPFLKNAGCAVIVNVAGHTVEEYRDCAAMLDERPEVDMLELNVSCPNVAEGGMAFGTNWKMTEAVTSAVRRAVRKPLIVKLSPNVTDIDVIARAAESAGAAALSLINTVVGMRIDAKTRKATLRSRLGGLSGPAVKPVALRMAYSVHKAVKIPIIGMGGITTGEDAVEFLLAGASAVAVGTANFMNPRAALNVIEGIKEYMAEYGVSDVRELTGALAD
jgi:dihydroorotate dehydrogenase (NAD+) catalytic subunit